MDSSSSTQLEAFVKDVRQLASEEIPMSDNSYGNNNMPSFGGAGRTTSFDEEHHDQEGADEDEGEDSWHPNEEETSAAHEDQEQEDQDEPSLDTRLDREIVFDINEMDDDDDFDFF